MLAHFACLCFYKHCIPLEKPGSYLGELSVIQWAFQCVWSKLPTFVRQGSLWWIRIFGGGFPERFVSPASVELQINKSEQWIGNSYGIVIVKMEKWNLSHYSYCFMWSLELLFMFKMLNSEIESSHWQPPHHDDLSPETRTSHPCQHGKTA